MMIKCKCGYHGDFDEFCSTPIFGELPANTYQCPKCQRAWQRKQIEPDRIIQTDAGPFQLPGKRECITTESTL